MMNLARGCTLTATRDGAMVLNENTGAILHLNASAHGSLNAALHGGAANAAAWLCTTYNIDEDTARQDATGLLEELHARGVVCW